MRTSGLVLPQGVIGGAPKPPTLKVHLRFAKSSRRVLRNLVERMKSEGIATEHINLFEQAAEACERNNGLLLVHCSEPDEPKQIAAGFAQFGIAEPTIEGAGNDDRPVILN